MNMISEIEIFDQEIRNKCFMIISAFEKHLGDEVKQNLIFKEEKTTKKILDRDKTLDSVEALLDIKGIVEASYLEEVFNLLIEQEKDKDTSRYKELNQLKKFCDSIELFEIRNKAVHPNRPIYESNWHLIAALATHPIINILNFQKVKFYYEKIKKDDIEEIPENLIINSFEIKNNLPNVDHSDTKLIGRSANEDELEKILSKARPDFISIVASGGMGKTALAIEVLTNISRNERFKNIYDAIIFCSLKYEKLTNQGIKPIEESIKTINGIKENILSALIQLFPEDYLQSYDDALEKLSDKKILLLIDNLETIKINDDFYDFSENRPKDWKILVTSRIPVDGAKTIKLQPLSENASILLCRRLLQNSTNDYKQDVQNKVAEFLPKEANYNPLGIIISTGRFILGGEMKEVSESTKKEILQFSFTDLTDRLHPISIEILEVLYAARDNDFKLNRNHLPSFIDENIDEIDSCLGELERISLITRKINEDDDEKIELKNGIYELLTFSPKNSNIRIKTAKKFKNTRKYNSIYLSKHKDIEETSPYFVKDSLSVLTKNTIIKLNQLDNQREESPSYGVECQDILNAFKTELNTNPNEPEIYFQIARIYQILKKLDKWYESIEKAYELSPDNNKYLNKLADALISYKKDYKRAYEITKKLLIVNHNSEEFNDLVKLNHVKSLRGLKCYDEITEMKFADDEYLLLFYKMGAYFELYFVNNNSNNLLEGFDIFSYLVNHKDNYNDTFLSRIIDTISYYINKSHRKIRDSNKPNQADVNLFIVFFNKNLDLIHNLYGNRVYRGKNLIFNSTVKYLCEISESNSFGFLDNINLKRKKFEKEIINVERENEIINGGYTKVTIIDHKDSGIFMRDNYNQSYFLKLNNTSGIKCSFNDFVMLEMNDKVFVKWKKQDYYDAHFVTEIIIN